MEDKLRILLDKMVTELSSYNQPDMLEGYLNPLGYQFNDQLEELGLSSIELVQFMEED